MENQNVENTTVETPAVENTAVQNQEAAGANNISVTRKTGYMGMGSRVKLFMNDIEVAKIKNDGTVFLPLPSDQAVLKVRMIHATELPVQAGDMIELKYNQTYLTVSWVGIAVLVIGYLFYPPLAVIGFLIVLATLFVKPYELKKIN